MKEQTTRERIIEILEREYGKGPESLSRKLEITESEVLEHIKHITESEDVEVIPPKCKNCEFDNFDNLFDPTKCPSCRSEWITNPIFTIRE
jgi:predicted Zn-ribbon and HTH transcriptional regulator